MSYSDCCDWSKCTACGKCLLECPVIDLTPSEATSEIKRLLDGEYTKKVLDQCTLCFNCNNYCPVDGLRPHELIQQRMFEARGGRISPVIKYILNGMPSPTLWSDMYGKLSYHEKEILRHWSIPPAPARDTLFVGCVGRLSCHDIENSIVLRDLPKFAPPDICCGEIHYRLGSWEAYTDMANKTFSVLENIKTDRLVCYCGSCSNFLSNILPQVRGMELPFKIISISEWLWEKLSSGNISVTRPIKYRAAIHESCYASELGENFTRTLKNLYLAAGMEPIELEHHGRYNLSCGAVSAARDTDIFHNMINILGNQRRKYTEVKKTGTRDIACNCPGCFLTLSPTSGVFNKKLHYMPDELLQAFGDTLTKPLHTRIPALITTMSRRLPTFLKKEHTPLPRIMPPQKSMTTSTFRIKKALHPTPPTTTPRDKHPKP